MVLLHSSLLLIVCATHAIGESSVGSGPPYQAMVLLSLSRKTTFDHPVMSSLPANHWAFVLLAMRRLAVLSALKLELHGNLHPHKPESQHTAATVWWDSALWGWVIFRYYKNDRKYYSYSNTHMGCSLAFHWLLRVQHVVARWPLHFTGCRGATACTARQLRPSGLGAEFCTWTSLAGCKIKWSRLRRRLHKLTKPKEANTA